MGSRIRFFPGYHAIHWPSFVLPLVALLYFGSANAQNKQDIKHDDCMTGSVPPITYNNLPNAPITGTDVTIALFPPQPTVTWLIGGTSTCPADSAGQNATCGTTTVTASPTPGGTITIKGNNPAPGSNFKVTATDPTLQTGSCHRTYFFNDTATVGGWGDPHLTTVDGIHYNFQSAGEFTALRGNGVEVQTRQTPVSTASAAQDPYTELPLCVSVYSAVAASVGTHRVTYEPSFGTVEPNVRGAADASSLQLRVDGNVTTLGPAGIDLPGTPIGGRIVQPWGTTGIEIDYSDGTVLIVTPTFWSDQQIWYLNVTITGTAADKGIFGKLPPRSWLPALPDGSAFGPRPDSLHQRYVELYGKFADGWRVTDASSLFDYAPGTSTATFTQSDWPRESPTSCAIQGKTPGQPVTVPVAEKACSAIVDPNMHADCIFDVSVTGFTGFAQSYQQTQQRLPGATNTTVKGDKSTTEFGENATFTATVAPVVAKNGVIPVGAVQFTVDGSNTGSPVKLDAGGHASWTTTALQVGQHQIAAKYAPAGWGVVLASASADESHTVIAASHSYWWVIVILVIILIVLAIWWFLRKK